VIFLNIIKTSKSSRDGAKKRGRKKALKIFLNKRKVKYLERRKTLQLFKKIK
jgi:hypothetical protein